MTDKVPRYRKLVESIAKLGDDQAKLITTDRYKLMYHYFIRCASLTSAVILLVENGYLAAAFASEKSVIDAMLNGLYIGYVASDQEIEHSIELALKGRCTGHSGMKKRAQLVDKAIRSRNSSLSGMFENIVKLAGERLNEFGHGGLLSTALDLKNLEPEVANKVLAETALALYLFIANVFLLENLDISSLETLQREFSETRA